MQLEKDEQSNLLQHNISLQFLDGEKPFINTVKSKIDPKLMQSRDKWGKEIEFLLSCIALSVGLGNVWRFPFTAYENGGGAFLIPYVIVLLLVGRPVYYMEVIIGQFCSQSSIKAFNFAPIMKGVAYGQVFATVMATTYYASIMGLTLRYLVASVSDFLPWAYCTEEWGSNCINSAGTEHENGSYKNESTNQRTSAEFYFVKEILKEIPTIDDGIGLPNWELVICLAASWIIIATTLIKGVKSSGKASYFLAVFPYLVMLILLVRSLTLPGAWDGIKYFLKPKWADLLKPKVWYAAVTQVFFSLAVCFGTLIMYASYNEFSRNVHRDVIIITTIDTFSSTLAGWIIFGILGNLAYETNAKDISGVVKGGAGLAFISYPDAIAKFTFFPQVFAILFFLMLFVLGIGSNIGMTSCVTAVIKDQFSNVKQWQIVVIVSSIGFLSGIVYMTPGGQFLLNLVDFHGTSFIGLVLAIAELVAVGWIYGVKRLCKDIEFMCGIKTGNYWRICWAIVTPGLMFAILIYTLFEYEPLEYNKQKYPPIAYVIGWMMTGIGVIQLPIWAFYTVYKQPETSWRKKLSAACKPTWCPLDPQKRDEYLKFCNEQHAVIEKRPGLCFKIMDNIFG